MAPDPVTQMNTYRSYVTMLGDPSSKDELKLKAAQELSENFEVQLSFQCHIHYITSAQFSREKYFIVF